MSDQEQERVAEAAEHGLTGEHHPYTGAVNLDRLVDTRSVGASMTCFDDAMVELRQLGGMLSSEQSVDHARALVMVRKAMLAMEVLHDEELAAAQRDRATKSISPTTEERLAHASSVAVDATEKALVPRDQLDGNNLVDSEYA